MLEISWYPSRDVCKARRSLAQGLMAQAHRQACEELSAENRQKLTHLGMTSDRCAQELCREMDPDAVAQEVIARHVGDVPETTNPLVDALHHLPPNFENPFLQQIRDLLQQTLSQAK